MSNLLTSLDPHSIGDSRKGYFFHANTHKFFTTYNQCIKRAEQPLSDSFPLPQNFKPEVELALMTTATNTAFYSQIARLVLYLATISWNISFTKVLDSTITKDGKLVLCF